ncbi:phage minor capsid protein [Rhodococcus ruber]|uniref:phage minor capsid protein n=1 Tax=Rhodococcus ruber TaxID=1830 RepID=UPI0037849062
MAIDPSEAQGLPDQLAAAYSAAELALLAAIAAAIADGIDTDDWYDRQTEQARRLYRVAQVMAAQLQGDMPALLQAAILEAHQLGVQGADTDLDDLPDDQVAPPPPEPGDGRPSRRARVAAIEGVQVLAQVTEQLPLQVQSLYRSVVAQVEVRERAKTGTRLDAAQQALDILTRRGITGFRDGAGRNWSLTSYIEMKSRTLVNQQLIDAHTERMVERGQRLIIVSSHRNPAPQCQPYEGQVLSLDGSTGTVVLPSATGGGAVKVRIRATLADARAAGFQHPNCRHAVSAYIPGATRTYRTKPDREGYEATQVQRALERRKRAALQRRAVAVTPQAKREAAARIRELNAQIKAHTEAHDLKRRPRRERTGVAR